MSLIHFDYDSSPYAQKTKLLLQASGLPFKKCDQPRVLPRPDLEALDITYRRIPLLAVGRDVYADSALITSTILTKLGGKLPTSPSDAAYETWGNAVFQGVIAAIPAVALDPKFVEDRATVFPQIKRPDFASLRPSALAEFKERCLQVERQFLGQGGEGPFIGGEELSLADVHVVWAVRWGLVSLGIAGEKGFGKEDLPKVWKLIESLPEAQPEVLGSEEAIEAVRKGESKVADVGFAENDPLGIEKGAEVTVESSDAVPGKHPQAGKLIGTSVDEVVLELPSGVRLHFPRIGYIVRKA